MQFNLTMLIYAAATGYTKYYFDAQSGKSMQVIKTVNCEGTCLMFLPFSAIILAMI